MRTIAHEFLDIEAEAFEVPRSCYETLDELVNRARERVDVRDSPRRILSGIDLVFKALGFVYRENNELLSDALKKKGIDCKQFSVLYYSLGEELGLPIDYILAPHHIFVRWDDEKNVFNWETSLAQEHDDEHYRNWLKISNEAINQGVYLRTLTRDEIKANAFYQRASVKLERGDINGAIVDYDHVLILNPTFIFGYSSRAGAKTLLQDFNGAIADCGRALRLDPHAVEAYNNRGIAKMRKGDLDGAIVDFDKAIELDPDHASAYSNRGDVRVKKRRFDEAISDYIRVRELNPKNPVIYCSLGFAKMFKGDLGGAQSDFMKSLELDPNNKVAIECLQEIEGRKRKLSKVVAGYDKITSLGANDYHKRGIIKVEGGDLDGAIADFSRALELNPNYAEAYYARGLAKRRKGDLDGAIFDYSRSINQNPNNSTAYTNRGAAKAAKGDLVGARSDLTKAIQLDSNNIVAREGLITINRYL